MSVPRIVVYDQDNQHRSACCDALRAAGFEPVEVVDRERVAAAADGVGVVAALVEPDAALGGAEVLEALRARGIPVLAMVSLWLGAMNRSIGVLYDGCADVLEKPVDDGELTQWLRRLFPDVSPGSTLAAPASAPVVAPAPAPVGGSESAGPESLRVPQPSQSTSGPAVAYRAPTGPARTPTGQSEPVRHQAQSDPATASMRTADQGMVPSRLDVRQVETAGEFEGTYFPTLMAYLAFGRSTGTLMLQRGDDKRLAYLEEGFVVGARTNQPDDSLTESMVVQGLMTPEQRMQVDSHAQANRISMPQSLVELRIFPEADVDTIVSAHLRNRLLDVFEWVEGSYTFKESSVPQGQRHEPVVSPMDFIWQGVQFATPFAVIRDTLSPFARHRLRWIGEPPSAGQMELTQSQTAFLSDVTGNLSLDDIRAAGRLNESVWRVAYVLTACGFISFRSPD